MWERLDDLREVREGQEEEEVCVYTCVSEMG